MKFVLCVEERGTINLCHIRLYELSLSNKTRLYNIYSMLVGDSYALAVYICVLKGQYQQKDNLRRSVSFSQYFSCGHLPQASKAQKSVTGMNLRKTEK